MSIRTFSKSIVALVLASAFATVMSAHANILVYEGFQYGPAGADQVTDTEDPDYNLLHGQPDGVGSDTDAYGLTGTWQDSAGAGASSDLFMNEGSLAFSNLTTSGNRAAGDTNLNNDIFSRSVTADLDGSSELWFSFAADKLQNNFNAAQGGVVIGNQTVSNAKIGGNDGTDGLQGFGIAPTTAGSDWTFYGWDGSSQTAGDDAVSASIGGGDVHLLVGKISFNTGSGGADQFSFFDTTDDGDLGSDDLVQIGSALEVNVDETLLDTLVVTRQVNTAYDEIRIGTTSDDVLGLTVIPEPSTLVLALLGLVGVFLRRPRRK